jgi:microcystin-dependent protein
MDASLNKLDTGYGGYLSLSLSGGNHQLTVAEASNPIIALSGTLSSNQYLYFPPIGGRRLIIPNLNLNGFVLFVRGNNGSDVNGVYFWTGINAPYGVVVTPSRVFWDYGGVNPGAIADMPVGNIGNGWLPLDGRWVDISLHDILYYLVVGGTWGVSGNSFKLGDFRGTVCAMADQVGTLPASGPLAINAGNRGILNSWGVNTFAGEANHALSIAEMPNHNHPGSGDSGHGHLASQDDHSHTIPGSPGGGFGQYAPPSPIVNQGLTTTSGASASGVYIQTGYANVYIGGQGGWSPHNNIQPTTTTIKMIKW